MGLFYIFIINVNDLGDNLIEFTQRLFSFANSFDWKLFSVDYFAKERIFKIGTELKEDSTKSKVQEIVEKMDDKKYRIRHISKKKGKLRLMQDLVTFESKLLFKLGEVFPRLVFVMPSTVKDTHLASTRYYKLEAEEKLQKLADKYQ